MALENDQRRELDDDELALIQSVIQQMSLALENQRLTDIAQHAAQREKQIAVAADKIHRANDLEAILRTAVAEISRITGVEDVGIQLGAGLDTGNGQVTTAMPAEPAPDHIVIEPA
jgi:GAF domain-containing protein